MDMTPQAWPDWYDGKHINEVLFCQQFLDKHPMKCVRGRLFTVDGLIEDEGQIGNLILEEISGVLTSGLSKVVTNLLASIKLQAYSPPLPIETDRIHVSNGTYFIDGSFTVVKSYCNNRLTVAYNPDAPTPKKWLQFLSELLQPEDIPTLQEFLGYLSDSGEYGAGWDAKAALRPVPYQPAGQSGQSVPQRPQGKSGAVCR